ncbi:MULTISPECIES: DUF2637 domain-containing protein [Streptomyces]|uniref:DUF2637 domain-containing protein n=2 Tax=Streptomyces TaxID=1883 RepID=A0A100Y0W6_9ACTN|nr:MULTISPECIES: DUF2637 domain-containing protein [Streptomyces]KUH35619.1 hypothetical protein ATE80_28260 [Streptomyces kanasensis]UUS32377.1 DUF2637 domain-containing protein [Streptomyces changanensis]
MAAMQLTRMHRVLIGIVVAGALVIAGIGFAGSYAAVRELAEQKGFGDFSLVFPIGIDAGICVLLALDLLLTWLRIPFPLLRQTAWLLTAATIAFNGAAAWPDPLGVGMHAVIPMLFVVAVEAARHAVGRIADITADKHMEGVRLTRWLLSPVPTFRLWRRMKLWELRSYDQVIKLEQDRLIYQARLQARFGRGWRRKAPVESLMPLRLAKYGVPLAETAPAGLAAAGIEPVLLPPQPTVMTVDQETPGAVTAVGSAPAAAAELPRTATPEQPRRQPQDARPEPRPTEPQHTEAQSPRPQHAEPHQQPQHQPQHPAPGHGEDPQPERYPQPQPQPEQDPQEQQPERPQTATQATQATQTPQTPQGEQPEQDPGPVNHVSPWFAAPKLPQDVTYAGSYDPAAHVEKPAPVPGPRQEPRDAAAAPSPAEGPAHGEATTPGPVRASDGEDDDFGRAAYEVFREYVGRHGDWPDADVLDAQIAEAYGHRHPRGQVLLRRWLPDFRTRYQAELEAEHIA